MRRARLHVHVTCERVPLAAEAKTVAEDRPGIGHERKGREAVGHGGCERVGRCRAQHVAAVDAEGDDARAAFRREHEFRPPLLSVASFPTAGSSKSISWSTLGALPIASSARARSGVCTKRSVAPRTTDVKRSLRQLTGIADARDLRPAIVSSATMSGVWLDACTTVSKPGNSSEASTPFTFQAPTCAFKLPARMRWRARNRRASCQGSSGTHRTARCCRAWKARRQPDSSIVSATPPSVVARSASSRARACLLCADAADTMSAADQQHSPTT